MGRHEDLERIRQKYAAFLATPEEPRQSRQTRGPRQASNTAQRTSIGMAIEPNKDGILYFRQSLGEHQACVTWHIDPPGEAHLRQRGIREGDRLTHPMFRELEQRGWLYKLRGRSSTRKPGSSSSPNRPQSNQAISPDPLKVKKIVETTSTGGRQTVWIVSKPAPINQSKRKKR